MINLPLFIGQVENNENKVADKIKASRPGTTEKIASRNEKIASRNEKKRHINFCFYFIEPV